MWRILNMRAAFRDSCVRENCSSAGALANSVSNATLNWRKDSRWAMIEIISETNMNRCTIEREAGTNMGMRFPDCKSFPDCKRGWKEQRLSGSKRSRELESEWAWEHAGKKTNGHEDTPEKAKMPQGWSVNRTGMRTCQRNEREQNRHGSVSEGWTKSKRAWEIAEEPNMGNVKETWTSATTNKTERERAIETCCGNISKGAEQAKCPEKRKKQTFRE